jgi:hypothetical protein
LRLGSAARYRAAEKSRCDFALRASLENKSPRATYFPILGILAAHYTSSLKTWGRYLAVKRQICLHYLSDTGRRRAHMDIEHENAERRAVEALAETLYESQSLGGVAWAKRSPTVREPWLVKARQQLQVSAPRGTRL